MSIALAVFDLNSGAPLIGFSVKITLISNNATTETGTTNSNGVATFADSEDGNYLVEITPNTPYYAYIGLDGEIRNNVLLIQNVHLSKLPIIQTFLIKDVDDTVIPGAVVTFTQVNLSRSKISDSDGFAVIDYSAAPFNAAQNIDVEIATVAFPKVGFGYIPNILTTYVNIKLANAEIHP